MPNYDFSQLSAFDFEMLMHGLLEREWGQRLEAFKAGRDKGIDLRYSSPGFDYTTIIQCKHYAGSTVSKLIQHLKNDEVPKVAKLSPDRYVLITSVGLTPPNKDEIIAIFAPHIKSSGDILGKTEINLLLEKHPEIEQKNFKLWLTSKAVLDRVIHNAELCRTDFAVEKMIKKLPLYVQNDCYERANAILDGNNIVIISGEPGIGKTTLGEMLLYKGLSDGYEPIIIRSDLKEGLKLYNKGVNQLFYYDDFLGQTFLREYGGLLLRNEDASLVEFLEMIKTSQTAKLVMTTREHILSNALLGSERLRRSPLLDHKCLLRISDYSRLARARILYNHIYFSELPENYRRLLIEDKFYEKIVTHHNFNPRLIEWLSSYRRVREIQPAKFRDFVLAILANPQEIWHEAFQRQISDYARSVILALFSFSGKVETHILKPAWRHLSNFEARKYNYPLSRDGFEGALKEVEGSFVTIEKGSVEFLNPSVKDFVSGEIVASPERLTDLIETSSAFQQLVTLWRWSRQSKTGPALVVIDAGSELFVSAVEASLARPYREVISFEKGSGERQLDLYPEDRLAALLAMADQMKSERLLALTPAVGGSILERWKETEPEFERTCDILRFMEQENWCKSRLDPQIYETVRNRTLVELANASSFYAFYWIDDFFKTTTKNPTDDEEKSFSRSFNLYIESSFSDDLWNMHYSGDSLDEMASFMSDMMERHGYDIVVQHNSVMQAIGERDQRDEGRADELQGHWRDSRSFERADEEAISSMFDSLK